MNQDHRPPAVDAADWDEMYSSEDAVWSGAPNAQLVSEVTALTPGAALDVGCGEGADSVWLAKQGWSVTGMDISSVAISRARVHAEANGVRADFQVRDVGVDPPEPRTYDLVSAQFFHLTEPPRHRVMASLGEAVSPGGHFLVVGHHPDGHTLADHQQQLFGLDEIAALFSPAAWTVVASEKRERRSMHRGEMTDLVDAVVLLRRCDETPHQFG